MMKFKLPILTACLFALAGCSVIQIDSRSQSSNNSSSTPAETSSASSSASQSASNTSSNSSTSQTSLAPGELGKTKMAQTYGDYADNNIYPIDSAPSLGRTKLLVIPVWFTDSNKYITNRDNVRADIEKVYLGNQDDVGWHSVKSFYETESMGRLSFTGTVSNWYECGDSMNSYRASSEGFDNTTLLVYAAADWYFSTTGEKRTDYDCDGDGYLDAIMLIYAAPDYSALGKETDLYNYGNLWAYAYWIQEEKYNSKSRPGPNTFFWASYDFMYDAETAISRTGKSRYGTGDCTHCSVDGHTFIHEMGHVFGLDDYYDYGENAYSPAGGFSMQDYNVGGHDPFSALSLGWADPYIPTQSCEIEIGAYQKDHDLILLTPSWNNYDSPFDEYLLLELYTPTGLNALDSRYQYGNSYPQGPGVAGIRLWHVDARLVYITSNNLNPDGSISSRGLSKQFTSDANYKKGSTSTNPYYYGVAQSFSNTTGDEDYGSILGSSYDKYDLLHLIRNSKTMGYKTQAELKASDLFVNGDSFSVGSYSKQFPNGNELDSGATLGWSFSVAITGEGDNAVAKVTLTKE